MKAPRIERFEPVLRDNLVRLARAYIAAGALPSNDGRGRKRPNTVAAANRVASRILFGDPTLLPQIISGKRSFTIRKYDDFIAKAVEIWPSGAAFPELTHPKQKKD